MSRPVGNHTVVNWNERKEEWTNLHPKLWETELGRQRMCVALKVIGAVGFLAASLMLSGFVGSFSAVVVTATGIAAIVAYVAGRHFGFPRRDLWKDPEFRVKIGKGALDRFGTGQNCIKDFKENHQLLFFYQKILKYDDIKALMLKKFNERPNQSPQEFAQDYGIEGLKLLLDSKRESLKTHFLLKLVNDTSITSWSTWYFNRSHSIKFLDKNIIEIVQLFGYDRKSLLSELCRLDMSRCESDVDGYTYPFIRERNTIAKMIEVDRERSENLFQRHFRSSNMTFSDMQRDFSDEFKAFYPNGGDIEVLAALDWPSRDASKPETYAAFKEKWGLEPLKKMSGIFKQRVAPVAKAYFATQKQEGLLCCSQKFGEEMEVLGITVQEIAPSIIDAEIAMLSDPNSQLTWKQFVDRNCFEVPNSAFVKPPYELMSDDQKRVVIPKFIESVVTGNSVFDNLHDELHSEECSGIGLSKEDFAKLLVAKQLKESTPTLHYLIGFCGLSPDLVTNANKDSLKQAFYRMDPKDEWNSSKYTTLRLKLSIGLKDMKAKFTEQTKEWEKTGLTVLASSVPDWYLDIP